MAYFVANKDGKLERKGTSNVQVKKGKKGIEVTLPDHLLRDVKKVELNWVDFYR